LTTAKALNQARSALSRLLPSLEPKQLERLAMIVFVAAFVVCDVMLVRLIVSLQPLAVDLMPLWVGARAEPHQLYDFAFITDQQVWIEAKSPRPFVYPPSALLLFKPLALLPFWPAYVVFIAATAALFAIAGRRLGADWRLLLLPMPVVLVALAGQVTLLIGALVMAALSLRHRPLLAGVLFGLTGALKPQMLVLLPLALAIEGNWRTFWATGATAAACILASLPFGVSWLEWLDALQRFSTMVSENGVLLGASLSPYAHFGAVSYLVTVPVALAGLWFAFRSGDAPQRLIALLGGALILSPYAMNYEIALLVPAVLALRKPLIWSAPLWLAMAFYLPSAVCLGIAMTLFFISLAPQISEALARVWPPARPQEA
jgi:hypothetical protein